MRDGAPGDVRQLDDVRALAALAHPDRARLMDALAVHGSSTTSALASALGIATGSVSHHLRVLARAGLVAPAEAGPDRRQSRWQLVTRGVRWSPEAVRDQPSGEAAATAADATLLHRDVDRARRFLATAAAPWRDAAFAGHYWLRLSPDELDELGRQVDELFLAWRRREVPEDGADRSVVRAFVRVFPSEP